MIGSLFLKEGGFAIWPGREGYFLFASNVGRVEEDASGLARYVITRNTLQFANMKM